MNAGIAPSVLLAQVQNTAAWALDPADPSDSPPDAPTRWRAVLRDALALESSWQTHEGRRDYLELLLAAHYATVGTFVPTDVDTRIRHHAWQEITGREALAAATAVVDRAAGWDPHDVSARVLDVPGLGHFSGHDGEWLSVRAGALGRALALHDDAQVETLAGQIDAELAREAAAVAQLLDAPRGGELDALRMATIAAHNLGDLSRVVEEWPVRSPAARALQARFARLGHEDGARYDGQFLRAGAVNKAVMAAENHRFLALRRARSLRRGRELLLPIGPFFDAWGERLGRSRLLAEEDRGDILGALLEGHDSDPAQQGYLRAMAGLHRSAPGGLEAHARFVPARLRKLIAAGPVREALRVDPARFEARVINRYRAALGAAAR